MPFDYPTNFSNGTTIDSLGNLIQYGQYVSDGWLAYGFLLIIFMMSFVIGSLTSSKKALLSSSFITFVFTVYFFRLGLVNVSVIFILIAIMIAGAIGVKAEGGNY